MTKTSPIFLSHIHEEQAAAAALKRFVIEAVGPVRPSVFLSSDRWQLRPGELWLERIRAELTDATIVLLLLSPQSLARPWVNFEAGAAWLTGKILIPVCFAGLRVGNLRRPYSDFQAVELASEDAAYSLLLGIAQHLHLMSPSPPPPRLRGLGDPANNRDAYEQLLRSLAPFG